MPSNRIDRRPGGLLIEAMASIVDRDVDWRAVRDCHAVSANAARIAVYRDRLAASLDPLSEPDALARRQLVGLRVQAEIRRRDRTLRLRRRLAMVPATTPAAPPQGTNNVVRLGGTRRT